MPNRWDFLEKVLFWISASFVVLYMPLLGDLIRAANDDEGMPWGLFFIAAAAAFSLAAVRLVSPSIVGREGGGVVIVVVVASLGWRVSCTSLEMRDWHTSSGF